MKVRYQADYDLNQEIVRILCHREPTIDFQTAHKAGLEGIDDDTDLGRFHSRRIRQPDGFHTDVRMYSANNSAAPGTPLNPGNVLMSTM